MMQLWQAPNCHCLACLLRALLVRTIWQCRVFWQHPAMPSTREQYSWLIQVHVPDGESKIF